MHRCASSKDNNDTFNTLGFHSTAVRHHTDVARSIVKSSDVLTLSGTKSVTDRDIGNSQLSGALLSAIREQIMSKPLVPNYLFTMQYVVEKLILLYSSVCSLAPPPRGVHCYSETKCISNIGRSCWDIQP